MSNTFDPRTCNAMRHHWLLIGLMLLAMALFDGADAAATRAIFVPSDVAYRSKVGGLPIVTLFGLALSQASLAGVWLALGRTANTLRLPVTAGVVIGWCALLTAAIPHASPAFAAVVILPPMGVTALLLMGARLWGLRRIDLLDTASKAAGKEEPCQFSIAGMLWLTAVLAVTMGILKWMGFLVDLAIGGGVQGLIIFGLGGATVALVAVWAGLGPGGLQVRITALAVAEGVLVASVFWLTGIGVERTWEGIALYVMSEALFLIGPLMVFRLAGYRVQWGGKGEEEVPVTKCDEAGWVG